MCEGVFILSVVAGISTPRGTGGLAVIRISGEGCIDIARRVFKPSGSTEIADMKGYTCCYGFVRDEENKIIDDCILTVFRAPHSYTGEDTVEISCHGGVYVSEKILRAVIACGAESAGAGEFTKRAFLNGKLDLTRAEAVMDVISANSEAELHMAENLRTGAVFGRVRECSEIIRELLASVAVWIDYPDEDMSDITPDSALEKLGEVRTKLEDLSANYDTGRILREGVSTAVVGKPNVGKSTLFNCLSGFDRSIVTEIAGTTRDVIEESVRLGNIVLRLADTAGIHQTDEIVEKIGVEHAQRLIDSSELVIAVFDGSCPCTADDFELVERIKNRKCVAVVNKNDREQLFDTEVLTKNNILTVYLSAKEKDGIDRLGKAVESVLGVSPETFSETAVNERQKRCIDRALECVREAESAIKAGEMFDVVNVLIDDAEQSLLELTGERVTEAVVNEVFSKFCVGK